MTLLSSVSVIVPVFNAAPFLIAALESIAAQSPGEIIIVDDGSTDGSHQLALDWKEKAGLKQKIHIQKQVNSGPAVARNMGISVAQGEFIAFLDADDIWPPQALQAQFKEWKNACNCNKQTIVMGLTQLFTQQQNEEKMLHGAPFRFLNVGSAFFPAQVFEKCGNFEPSLHASEDVDWFLRARDFGLQLHVYSEVTLWYRRHETNMTRGQSLENLGFHNALKRSLDRRRTQNRNYNGFLQSAVSKEIKGHS